MLAFRRRAGSRLVIGAGAAASPAATVTLVVQLVGKDPLPLGFVAVLVLMSMFGRPFLVQHLG